MTISTWLMILALAVGSGTSQLSRSNPTMEPAGVRPPLKPAGNCWINGVWYNPCPASENEPQPPHPDPIIQPPSY